MRQTFNKDERLKSKKIIEELFKKGQNLYAYPLLLKYLPIEHPGNFPVQIAFSVPKKKIKKATQRNRIKRQLREIYRQHKNDLYTHVDKKIAIILIFIDERAHNFVELEEQFLFLLKQLERKKIT
ncbi:MAG: ribonuclease P protein component [Flavobacteriales bacterium]|nr:MAG: ribonuclease P protein component [Flavobacteriales bacterium]